MRQALIAVLALAGTAMPAAPAAACTCVSFPLCQRLWLDGAPESVFFEGTVVAVSTADADGFVRVHLADVRTVRGTSSTTVVTRAHGDTCGYAFAVGERYLIDAAARDDGRLETSTCSNTALLADAEETLTYLRRLERPGTGGRIFGEALSDRQVLTMFDENERRPLRGVRIELTGDARRSTTTDASGAYAFDGLPPGRYQVHASTPEGQRLLTAPDEAVLPNAWACVEQRFVFERSRRPRPWNPSHRWVPGLLRQIRRDDGRFRLMLAPGPRYRLVTDGTPYPRGLDVGAGTGPLTLVVQPHR